MSEKGSLVAFSIFVVILVLVMASCINTALNLETQDTLNRGAAGTLRVKKSFIDGVYDGDTLFISVPHWPRLIRSHIGVRLKGIQAPEIRTRNACEKRDAYLSRDTLREILGDADLIMLRNMSRGKYFRIVAELWAKKGDRWFNVSEVLVDMGHGVEYFGGTRPKWECSNASTTDDTVGTRSSDRSRATSYYGIPAIEVSGAGEGPIPGTVDD